NVNEVYNDDFVENDDDGFKEYYNGDNEEDDNDEARRFLCSTTVVSHHSMLYDNRPVFADISNIDHSICSTISCSDTGKDFPTALSVRNSNDRHKDKSGISNLRNTIDHQNNNILSQQKRIRKRHRRQSEEGVPHTNGTNDRPLIYDSLIDELHAWLKSTLRDGRLIPLTDAQHFYNQIVKSYSHHENDIDYSIRCDNLRKQLESKFPDHYHFETVTKRDGTYIALNNISHYSREAICFTKSSIIDVADCQQPPTIISQPSKEDTVTNCEIIFNAVRLLRSHMNNSLHVLETLFKEPEKMTELTNDLFADCVPVAMRNFIGFLTTSNRQFKKLEADYVYYNFFNEDLFQASSKSLKNTAIGHDILNARHDHIVFPKHILLANEICKHGRSNELLSIMNRFGHVASYKTITRIHRKIANNQMTETLPSGVLSDCYLVQVADNFDLNRETLHGERSFHFLNRIFVQTPENNKKENVNKENNNCDIPNGKDIQNQSNTMNTDVSNFIDNNNQICSTPVLHTHNIVVDLDEPDEAPQSYYAHEKHKLVTTHEGSDTSMEKIRAMDKILLDHSISFYHDFEPFIDHSLAPHLFAYGCIKSYCNRLGENNVPLYSGFMAIHLPHTLRPRHKVTFMSPINNDPNKLETAEACMTEMKKILIDSGLQNNCILVVDERIFRLCIEVKDEQSLNFDGIFLYPGDFHMMRCAMKVIWGVLEESGIDTLIGELYKGATLRAILSVAHFNKSLRAIKLLYTALLIYIHEEFFQTLTTDIINEFEQVMSKMPTDLANIEEKKRWYTLVLDYLSNIKLQDKFDLWIQNNCENNLKFRFWTFVLYNLITPLIKLYTSLRTHNFSARNASICELAELFFATNHRQYARLTARHLSDLRVCPQQLLDHLSKSFAVTRSNRNFSSIALDQTIEVTINKMGKGHGGITGRCSVELIDIWSKSYAFRSLLSTITSELAGVESSVNSIESHIECSTSRMLADHADLQIILDKLVEEKLFSLDTKHVTQLYTGKIIHQNIIESNCQIRRTGAEALKTYIHERLVNCSFPLSGTLHASALLRIRDNDAYKSTTSSIGQKSKKKSTVDVKKIDAEIRRILFLAQYRSIDLV
ncbi:unnamed protein product, partial [Rotaria sp. Silwood2]